MSIENISPIDGRYARVTEALQSTLSEHAFMHYRMHVELKWLKFLCNANLENIRNLTSDEKTTLKTLLNNYSVKDSLRIKEIEKTTRHDVKAVEYFIREKLKGTSLEDVGEFIHFACTSEDINNLAYSMMLREAVQKIWLPLAKEVVLAATNMANNYRDVPMMARTHGQPASPTTLGKELAVFVWRWQRQIKTIERNEYLGKFAGAVGNFNAHTSAYPNADWPKLAKTFVESLGLTYNPLTTQIESHDWMSELFHGMARFQQIALGFAQDIWQYIGFGYFKQQLVAGEIGSSTMPHKVNPIDFENSEANFGLANANLHHLATKLQVSRLQRDLSDSSALRNIGVGIGHGVIALNSLRTGLAKLQLNKAAVQQDLENEWALLAEPIQTIMRKHNLVGGYEKLKDLTRGERITEQTIQEFIKTLELPTSEKERLLKLRPETYTGLASQLVNHIFKNED